METRKKFKYPKNKFHESDSYSEDDERLFQSKSDGTFFDELNQRKNRFGENRFRFLDDNFDNYISDYIPSYVNEYNELHDPSDYCSSFSSWELPQDHKTTYFGLGPKNYQRSSDAIRDEACEILANNKELNPSHIEVQFSNGILYLDGEVNSRYDKKLAEVLIENIDGVEDVQNSLKIIKRFKSDGWFSDFGNMDEQT